MDVCSVGKILSICDRQYDLQSDGRVPGAMDNLQSHTRGGGVVSQLIADPTLSPPSQVLLSERAFKGWVISIEIC